MTAKLTPDQLKELLPTVTIRGEKPTPMIWLTQADALTAMRNVERIKNEEIAALEEKIDMLRNNARMTRLIYGGV